MVTAMKQTIFFKFLLQVMLVTTCTIVLTLIILSVIINYDNKYMAKAEIVQNNFAVIPEKGYCALVDGWELYPDTLLFPGDFSSETSSYYSAWAGQYPNLALFHEDKNPYGAATWRLHLKGNGNIVTLYLQEPLCAARVFVNGHCLGGSGEVSFENYSPLIKDTAYSFILENDTELIIQTANYSHYYGGIWYAPVIGDPDSIVHLIAARMLLYGLFFFSSITLSLFCIILWRRKNTVFNNVEFYFGMLSFSFALRICYPFLRLFGIPLVRIPYAIEDTAALFIIYFSIKIAGILFLTGLKYKVRKILHTFFLIVCGGMCCVSFIIPLFILPFIPSLVLWYGPVISWYKVIMAILLISLTAYGCFTRLIHTKIIFASAIANGICLLYSVLTIGYYEPFIGAYLEEYGAYCMVIAFAVLMVRRSRMITEENLKLNLNLQEKVNEKTEYLQKLLVERGQLISELGHDMKSPLTSLSNMAQIIRINNIMLDQDTYKRILHIEEQCEILSDRLKSIQEIAARTSSPIQMEPIILNTFLSDFYHNYRPIIELYGPNFFKNITTRPCSVLANHEQIFRALENLLYNAADFTPPDGKITLSLTASETCACISISDTGCGISEENLPNIFKRSYTTRKDKGGQGLGLAITYAIISEHGGKIEVSSEQGKGTTFTISLPLITDL